MTNILQKREKQLVLLKLIMNLSNIQKILLWR